MENHQTALFTHHPFTIEDLLEQPRKYEVVKTIDLGKIDYENFINDFLAERWFIEENADKCHIGEDGVFYCILVRQKGKKDGVLVMPDGGDCIKWAAY